MQKSTVERDVRTFLRSRTARMRRLGLVGMTIVALGGASLVAAASSSAQTGSTSKATVAAGKSGVVHAEGVVQ